MASTERIHDILHGPLRPEYLREREQAGWRLAAVEWERDLPAATAPDTRSLQQTPFGLRVAGDYAHLEEDPDEMQFLLSMMELIIQDISLFKVAEELNRKGFRMRNGNEWGPVAIFNMLPRLIEVGPRLFSTEEWEARRHKFWKSA